MNLPFFVKIILNIIFYIIYVLITSILIGLIIWFILNYFNKPWIVDWTNISFIVQWIIAIIVLFITIVSRKYFYISCDDTEVNEIKEEKKVISETKSVSNTSDDELDISILKEK